MIRGGLAGLLVLASCAQAQAQVQNPTIAIIHACAWTMATLDPVKDATIIVSQGHIRSVVPNGPVPAGARVIDATGRTVTPGLINGGTQLGLSEVLEVDDLNDQSIVSGPLGPAFDISYAINGNSTLIPVARADGLSRAMVFPGGAATAPFAGRGALIHLIEGSEILERPRAALFASVGDATLAKAGGSRAAQWGLLRNALSEARRFATRHGDSPRDQLLNRPDIEALIPVVTGAMPLAIAADRESDIRQAIRLAADETIKVVILGGAEAWRAARDLSAARIPVVLDPEINLPQTFDALGARADNAAILAKADVPIGFSVAGNGIYLSYDAGLALREGAGLAVANGLAYAEALRALTSGVAAIWGWPGKTGMLVPGADADLVLWDGDPLEPASAPDLMMIAGRQVSLETRQTDLRDRYTPVETSDLMPPGYR